MIKSVICWESWYYNWKREIFFLKCYFEKWIVKGINTIVNWCISLYNCYRNSFLNIINTFSSMHIYQCHWKSNTSYHWWNNQVSSFSMALDQGFFFFFLLSIFLSRKMSCHGHQQPLFMGCVWFKKTLSEIYIGNITETNFWNIKKKHRKSVFEKGYFWGKLKKRKKREH